MYLCQTWYRNCLVSVRKFVHSVIAKFYSHLCRYEITLRYRRKPLIARFMVRRILVRCLLRLSPPVELKRAVGCPFVPCLALLRFINCRNNGVFTPLLFSTRGRNKAREKHLKCLRVSFRHVTSAHGRLSFGVVGTVPGLAHSDSDCFPGSEFGKKNIKFQCSDGNFVRLLPCCWLSTLRGGGGSRWRRQLEYL